MDIEQNEITGLTTADVAAEVDQAVLDRGLENLAANRDRPYYDAAADADAAAQYYSGVDATASGPELMSALQSLVKGTHSHTPHYKPTDMVYPWVDLHPDRQLRSIYSGKTFSPEDVIRDDARIEAERTTATSRFRGQRGSDRPRRVHRRARRVGRADAVQLRTCGAAVVLREEGADAWRSAPPVHLRIALQQLPKQHTVLRIQRRSRGDAGLRQV